MNTINNFIKKNSPLIMTMVSSVGVIVTTVLAIKATPKAMQLIKEAEDVKGDKLTVVEKIKYGWKPYGYCMISGLSTVICILSINYLNSKKQASIISAYTLLQNTFDQYRNNVQNLYSKDVDQLCLGEIVKAKYDPRLSVDGDEECLFFDYTSCRFFKAPFHHVMRAEAKFKDSLISRGHATLNEYYDYLGIEPVSYGYQLGWSDIDSCEPYNCKEFDFEYDKIIVGEGIECWIITTTMPPTFDYII